MERRAEGAEPLLLEDGLVGAPPARPPHQLRRVFLSTAAALIGVLLLVACVWPRAHTLPSERATIRGAPLAQPEMRLSQAGALHTTLTVAPATFAAADFHVNVRAYEGMIPGPTLVVSPGDTLTIELVNALGPEEVGPEEAKAEADKPADETSPLRAHRRLGHAQVRLEDGGRVPAGFNALKLPNTTSLHVHGMHVSPRPGSDDIYTAIAPGKAGTYTYRIPPNHPLGLYYYHPHLHGSSGLQAHGGMAGAIVVARRGDVTAAAVRARMSVLVVQTWNVAAGTVRNLAWAAEASGSRLPLGLRSPDRAPRGAHDNPSLAKGRGAGAGERTGAHERRAAATPGVALTVNGQLEPRAAVAVGRWARVRLVHAGHNDLLLLSLARLPSPAPSPSPAAAADGSSTTAAGAGEAAAGVGGAGAAEAGTGTQHPPQPSAAAAADSAAAALGASWLEAEEEPRVLAALDRLMSASAPATDARAQGGGSGSGGTAAAPSCVMVVLARDGIELATPRVQSRVLMSPGSRAELLLRCDAPGTFGLRTDAPKPPPQPPQPPGAASADAEGRAAGGVAAADADAAVRAHVGAGSDVASGLLLTLLALPASHSPTQSKAQTGGVQEQMAAAGAGLGADEAAAAGEGAQRPPQGLYASLDLRSHQLPPSARLLVPMLQGTAPVQRPVGGGLYTHAHAHAQAPRLRAAAPGAAATGAEQAAPMPSVADAPATGPAAGPAAVPTAAAGTAPPAGAPAALSTPAAPAASGPAIGSKSSDSDDGGGSRGYTWYGMLDSEYDQATLRSVELGAVEEWELINERTLAPSARLPPPVPAWHAQANRAAHEAAVAPAAGGASDMTAGGAVADTNHPFHLHVNHFQVVAIHAPRQRAGAQADGGGLASAEDAAAAAAAAIDYEVGDWRDTITVPTPGSVTVRWRADDFDGVSMAHCHIFGHSDTGMSMDFEIVAPQH